MTFTHIPPLQRDHSFSYLPISSALFDRSQGTVGAITRRPFGGTLHPRGLVDVDFAARAGPWIYWKK
jgi:hypothetical protein